MDFYELLKYPEEFRFKNRLKMGQMWSAATIK